MIFDVTEAPKTMRNRLEIEWTFLLKMQQWMKMYVSDFLLYEQVWACSQKNLELGCSSAHIADKQILEIHVSRFHEAVSRGSGSPSCEMASYYLAPSQPSCFDLVRKTALSGYFWSLPQGSFSARSWIFHEEKVWFEAMTSSMMTAHRGYQLH